MLDNEKRYCNHAPLERVNPNEIEETFNNLVMGRSILYFWTVRQENVGQLLNLYDAQQLFDVDPEGSTGGCFLMLVSGSRVTAQRSQEDAEEVERERRRRSREKDRGEDSGPQENRTGDTQSVFTVSQDFISGIFSL